MRPLDGVTILDLTRLLPGGLCTLLLADLGADVIKVEEPGTGDHFRQHPPFQDGVSTIHLLLNREKRSLAVDLKQPKGKKILEQLVSGADVLVESFRPGVMDRLGMGCGEMCTLNPRLVYCSITGFGQESPNRGRPGHDLDYTAMAGLLSLPIQTGAAPTPFGAPLADYASAWAAALAIVAALLARKQTGIGRTLDISLADCAFACSHLAVCQQMGGITPKQDGAPFWGGAPYYRAYETADGGHVTVSNYEPKFWRNLCEALGWPDLAEAQHAVGEERERIVRFLESTIRTRTRDEWAAFFQEHDCCGAVVNDTEGALREPQFRERGRVYWSERPGSGPVLQMASPLGGLERPQGRPAPTLGQHTTEILCALGYNGEVITQLAAQGIVREDRGD